jgi:hypothetical protein
MVAPGSAAGKRIARSEGCLYAEFIVVGRLTQLLVSPALHEYPPLQDSARAPFVATEPKASFKENLILICRAFVHLTSGRSE